EKLAVYINSDSNGRGFLGVGGSQALEQFVQEVADAVVDPQTGVSVAERSRARMRVAGRHDEASRTNIRLSPLGSGSDYTPFLQHLGIASLNVGYGGESGGGSYHSTYDSYDHYRRFGDPGFAYGIALAQTAGRMTLRLSEADVLPFVFGGLADNVAAYAEEVVKLAETMRTDTERINAMIRDSVYTLASDPTETYVPPAPEAPVPHIEFASLLNAVDDLKQAAARYDKETASLMQASPSGEVTSTERMVNRQLVAAERLLTQSDGLPGRKWFTHFIYAPGFYTGYGVKTLPAVREALEERDYPLAETGVTRTAQAISRLADRLDELADEIR
ncbi:MAG: folate hydrolase, partial [Bacteroidetes bacterium]|nr:folate hydrolase [Bacteroidota bacterium]